MTSNLTKLGSGERAREDNPLRTALLDSVTHEFRTPLTAIKAAITALLTDSNLRLSQRKELLSIINEEADRLNLLIGEAAATSRLESRVELDLKPQEILSIVNAATADCRTLLRFRSLSIQFDQGLPPVSVDLQKAQKVLVQLIENATKYSPPDEPITIMATLSGDFVTVSVVDRGSGIEESEQKLIFERFYRGKNHRGVVHGTGMGLSIANAIIKAHGGSLRVRSQQSHGSTSSFTLPIHRERPEHRTTWIA
ncbi:MAG TPA: ATP-binding protein [Candidatus Solibacter sp.]|nr:ATP-binding protein [Candidatus Solibacter sp.]